MRSWARIVIGIGLGIWLGLSLHGDLAAQNLTAQDMEVPAPWIAQGTTDSSQSLPSPLEWVQLGKQHYDAEQYQQANQDLQQAIVGYAALDDWLNQAQALGLQAQVLQKLGDWQVAQNRLDQSLALLAAAPNPDRRVRAQVLNTQGQLDLAIGQAASALEIWEQATADYAAVQDQAGLIGSQLNQLQALQSLGWYHRADQLRQTLDAQLQQLPDSPLKVKGLLSFGDLLRLQGDLQPSQQTLNQARSIALRLNLQQEVGQADLSLGNTARVAAARAATLNLDGQAQTNRQAALHYYQTAAMAPGLLIKTQAQLNQLQMLVALNRLPEALVLIPPIQQSLAQLPVSRTIVDAQINLANSLMQLFVHQNVGTGLWPPLESQELEPQVLVPEVLNRAIDQAQTLRDRWATALAVGTLGHWYEQQQTWTGALALTEQALQQAQSIRAPELVYQWQWQMGRLLQAETEMATHTSLAQSQALDYYTAAVATLDGLRSDLVTLNPDVQFSFRESVEPVYRQLVDLLLRDPQPTADHLVQARNVIESLQLAELDNFFRDTCAHAQTISIGSMDLNAAVVYPIMLPDRLEIILQLPPPESAQATATAWVPAPDRLRHYRQSQVSEDSINQVATDLRDNLTRPSTPIGVIKDHSQLLYNWLIQPFYQDLMPSQTVIRTLVFVLDGTLRNLPMAVLYDGEHYLVEQFAVAVTPGLQLLESRPLQRQSLQVLLGGTANAPSFIQEHLAPLNYVDLELSRIAAMVPTSQVLLDQQFQQQDLKAQLEGGLFNVVHLATHGQFSADPEQTFILDWQQRVLPRDLGVLLTSEDPDRAVTHPIELLVLSACETAAGDRRAALGLAGMALRAGARSTLATLWQVDDASTADFMVQFYQALVQPQTTKAEALRQVQLAFLAQAEKQNRHLARPYFWAPFILVGNWL